MKNVEGSVSSEETELASTKMTSYAWKSEKYSKQYYHSGHVDPDEQAAAAFEIEFLRRQRGPLSRGLEYGCGPTLQRAIAAAKYVSTLDVADYDPINLELIRKWVEAEKDSDVWNQYTEYILTCEGIPTPNREQ